MRSTNSQYKIKSEPPGVAVMYADEKGEWRVAARFYDWDHPFEKVRWATQHAAEYVALKTGAAQLDLWTSVQARLGTVDLVTQGEAGPVLRARFWGTSNDMQKAHGEAVQDAFSFFGALQNQQNVVTPVKHMPRRITRFMADHCPGPVLGLIWALTGWRLWESLSLADARRTRFWVRDKGTERRP